jgi:hypothetical protein
VTVWDARVLGNDDGGWTSSGVFAFFFDAKTLRSLFPALAALEGEGGGACGGRGWEVVEPMLRAEEAEETDWRDVERGEGTIVCVLSTFASLPGEDGTAACAGARSGTGLLVDVDDDGEDATSGDGAPPEEEESANEPDDGEA